MFRIEKLTRLVNVIDELEEEKITFSTATKRTKRDHWKRESKAFMSLLGKIVGSDRQDKASYLLYHLRSLYPFRSHISVCVDDFDVMRDYSAISQNSRSKLGKTIYGAFDKLLTKIFSSTDQDTQTKFVCDWFGAAHNVLAAGPSTNF